MNNKSAVIVIPTTGAHTLADACNSAINQTYENCEVWAVIDGPQFSAAATTILSKFPTIKVLQLPANTGANGWYGHRIYAAVSYLINHDYILYLDQDNWYEPTHVEYMLDTCESSKLQWCYSLRKIHDLNGTYICDDNCESLGKWPLYLSDQHFLVDTSTYCISRDVIVQIAPAWYSGWGGDRRFYSAISKHFPVFECTGHSTVCYRLDGNTNSVNAEFFVNGNKIMNERYNGKFPWRK